MPSPTTSGVLVRSSLRLIGAIATGETPTADEMNDGISSLNDLLENLSTQNLAVYGSAVEVFPTIASQAVYTIGPGGNWNTVRPVRIAGDAICTFSGVDFPVEQIGQGEYDDISLKAQQQAVVEKLLYVNANPLGLITLWPVPAGVVNITLNTDRVLTQVADAFTAMLFPPGYMLMMRYMLGILMAPDYGITIPPEILGIASKALADVKRANKVKRRSTFDSALVGDWSSIGLSLQAIVPPSNAAATPTFSPGAGTYGTAQSVTISSITPGSTIYYTTDGSTPTTSSTLYMGPVTVGVSETLKAYVAVAPGYTPSAVGIAAYVIGGLLKPLGTDVSNSLTYYGTQQPFLNLMKSAGQAAGNYTGVGWLSYTAVAGADTIEGTLVNYDANYYPLRVPQAGLTATVMMSLVCFSVPLGTGASFNYPPGVYRVQFTGTGTVVIDGADASLGSGTGTNGLTFTNAGTGTVSFTFTASGLCTGGGGFRLWITSSNPSNNGNNVRAISIVQNSLTASFDGGAIFHPNFLASIANYASMRYENWLRIDQGEFFGASVAVQLNTPATAMVLNINWKEQSGVYPFLFDTGQVINGTCVKGSPNVALASPVSTNVLIGDLVSIVPFKTGWANRALPSWAHWSTSYGVPHEICIALSNLQNMHCWTNARLLYYDIDHTNMATLYASTLNSNLNCYVELSNETWNSAFQSYHPCYQLAAAVFAPALGTQNDYQLQYKAYRTAVMAELWKAAWGTTAFARVFPVYGGAIGNTYSATFGLNSTFWTAPINGYSGPASAHPIKCIAIAPYFPIQGGIPSTADANKMLAQVDGGLDYLFQSMSSNVITGGTLPGTFASIPTNGILGQTLHGGGGFAGIDGYLAIMATYPTMKLVAYEGGQQFDGGNPGGTTPGLYTWPQLLTVANRDARMGATYTTYLNYWASAVGATLANINHLYNDCGAYSTTYWGEIESVMQTLSPLTSAPQRFQAVHLYIGA